MDTLVVDLPSMEDAEIARFYGTQIGRGAYRRVFHVKGSRWAYKFELSERAKELNVNRQEYKNFITQRSSLPPEADFPEMELLPNGVIAIEFVDGILAKEAHSWKDDGWDYIENCMCSSHRVSQCWKKVVYKINMKDLHGSNIMIRRDGKIMIIDIGEYGES